MGESEVILNRRLDYINGSASENPIRMLFISCGTFSKSHLTASLFSLLLIIVSSFTMVSSIAENDNLALVGIKFESHPIFQNIFTGDSQRRIFLISLIDGTLLAIDSRTGITLWTINEEDSSAGGLLFSQIYTSGNEMYVPSTSGDLYKVDGNTAQLVTYDPQSGRTDFNKNYVISSSRQEVITLGIDILTGKLYYYCSSSSCFKNDTHEIGIEDYPNLLVVKRIIKVFQMLDLSNGKEIVKFTHGSHEAFMFQDPGAVSTGEHYNTILHYDIESNMVYGVSRDNGILSETCWKVSLPSSIVSSWTVDKTGLYFSITKQELAVLVSNSFNWKDKKFELNSIDVTKQGLDCNFPVYLSVFDNFAVINKLFYSDNSLCKNLKILAFYNKYDEKNNKFISSKIETGKLAQVIEKLKLLPSKNYEKISSESSHNLKVKVTWRSISLKKVNEFNSSIGLTFSNNSELIVFVSIFAFWKEIFSTALIVVLIIRIILKKFRRIVPITPPPIYSPLSINDISVEEISTVDKVINHSSTPSNLSIVPSRYATDFEHIESIGSGGFGIVAKARNLVDDCLYAVKRVSIPDCVMARQQVMREVQALAKLNHPNIIRFYNAWFEISSEPCNYPNSNSNDDNNEQSTNSSLKVLKSSSRSFKIIKNPKIIKKDSLDDLIYFEKDDTNDSLWDGIDTSSSLECSADPSSLSKQVNFTNYSIIKNCQCSEKCLHKQKVSLFIQMELCHKQTLRSWLWKNINRNVEKCFEMFVQILSGLRYFHSFGMMHRDLKPSNIFFSFDGTVKIGDFGLASRFLPASSEFNVVNCPTQTDNQLTLTKIVGTELYMSPELLDKKPYNYKIDIFSLGLILFELLVPFKTDSERRNVLTMVRFSNFPDDCPTLTDKYIEFIKLMLCIDPDKRPTTDELFENQLVQSVVINSQKKSRSHTYSTSGLF